MTGASSRRSTAAEAPGPVAAGSSLSSDAAPEAASPASWSLPGPLAVDDPAGGARVLTLLLLVCYVDPTTRMATPLLALAVAALLWPSLRGRWDYWAVLLAALIVRHPRLWETLDNHQWLLTYWVAGVTLALATARPQDSQAIAGRRLIGLCFLIAVAWKIGSPEFRDGTFFRFVLAGADPRFDGLSRALAGSTTEQLASNRQLIQTFLSSGDPAVPISLHISPSMVTVARLMTGWTLLIEAALALAFLWPEDRGPSRWRHPLLLLFVLSTYSIAPVTGFGWILLAMGFADSARTSPRMRLAYLASFVALPVLGLPLARVLPPP